MVKKVVLRPPEQEVKYAAEFVLFLLLFMVAMVIGILAYLSWKGMISFQAPQAQRVAGIETMR